tara:strand:+ start:569 stop:880 length:312 start_codon:yes stop_codon:yes gene_type:complete
MKKSEVTIDAHGRKINLRFDVLDNYMKDGKPLGLDKKPLKTKIFQQWRSEKWRMDYSTYSNMETTGWHLKEFDDLVEHIKYCLRHGHIIEIIPDYDRPVEQKY